MDNMLRCDYPSDGNGNKTILLPQPANYKDLLLALVSGSGAATDFGRVAVLANGKPTIDLDGEMLDAVNQLDNLGSFATDGVLRIPFGLTGAADPGLADITGINVGTKNPDTGSVIRSLQLNMKVAGMNTPTWSLGANVSTPDPNGPGIVRYLLQYDLDVAADKDTPLTLPQIYGSEQNAYIRRVLVKKGAGSMNSMRIDIGKDTKWDSDLVWSNRLLTDSGIRNPAAATNFWGMIAEFPPDARSGRMLAGKKIEDMPWLNIRGADQLNQSLRIVLNNSVSENLILVVESIGVAPGV